MAKLQSVHFQGHCDGQLFSGLLFRPAYSHRKKNWLPASNTTKADRNSQTAFELECQAFHNRPNDAHQPKNSVIGATRSPGATIKKKNRTTARMIAATRNELRFIALPGLP